MLGLGKFAGNSTFPEARIFLRKGGFNHSLLRLRKDIQKHLVYSADSVPALAQLLLEALLLEIRVICDRGLPLLLSCFIAIYYFKI